MSGTSDVSYPNRFVPGFLKIVIITYLGLMLGLVSVLRSDVRVMVIRGKTYG